MPTGGIDPSRKSDENEQKNLLLAYIIVVVIRRNVFLVQVTVTCHRVPGPSRIPNDSADVIPVIFGTGSIDHGV